MSYLKKVKSAQKGNIYLVNGKVEGKATWFYMLVDKPKIPIFERLYEKGENVDLKKFGIILKAGNGENPPPYIIDKINIEGADYDDSEFHTILDHPDMKYFIKGEAEDNETFYSYVIVPGGKAEEFMTVSRNGGCSVADYGEVVIFGQGEPPLEIRKEMEEQGFRHPEFMFDDA